MSDSLMHREGKKAFRQWLGDMGGNPDNYVETAAASYFFASGYEVGATAMNHALPMELVHTNAQLARAKELRDSANDVAEMRRLEIEKLQVEKLHKAWHIWPLEVPDGRDKYLVRTTNGGYVVTTFDGQGWYGLSGKVTHWCRIVDPTS